MTIRVLIADDHALVRAGLKMLVAAAPGLEVIGEAADGREAIRNAAELQPQVALVNISMPGLNGLDATRTIVASGRTRVLVVSLHTDAEYARRALAAGAMGYLVKVADPTELPLAIKAVAAGQIWLSPPLPAALLERLRAGKPIDLPPELLSPRQREVLQLIAEGETTKEIARRLVVSPKTIEAHRGELMRRLGARGVAELVRWAVRLGLVPALLPDPGD